MSRALLALDGSVSPYLPTQEILDALAGDPVPERTNSELAAILRQRLATLHAVIPARIALFPHDATRLERLLEPRRHRPLVDYVPNDGAIDAANVIRIERTDRFRLENAQIERTPMGATALVITPNDPTGTSIALTTAAQLARRAGLLILDERSAEMQRRSMIPLVEEFDSIVLMRSFDDWAGLGREAPGYAITTIRIATEIDRSDDLSRHGLLGALAAVSDATRLDAIAQRVRLERLRLYRMLRKLNFLVPVPSDAGYVLAKIERGDRDEIARGLRERNISVYIPHDPRLARFLRFSAISPTATRRLQEAAIEIGRALD